MHGIHLFGGDLKRLRDYIQNERAETPVFALSSQRPNYMDGFLFYTHPTDRKTSLCLIGSKLELIIPSRRVISLEICLDITATTYIGSLEDSRDLLEKLGREIHEKTNRFETPMVTAAKYFIGSGVGKFFTENSRSMVHQPQTTEIVRE